MQRMEERKVTSHGWLMFGVGLRWPFEPDTGVLLATDAPTVEDDGASADESDGDVVTDDGFVRLTVGRGAATPGGTSRGNDSGDQTDTSQHMRLTNGSYGSKFQDMKFTDIPNNYQELEDWFEENGEEILKYSDRIDEIDANWWKVVWYKLFKNGDFTDIRKTSRKWSDRVSKREMKFERVVGPMLSKLCKKRSRV
jgi:hypothetical protein